MSSINVPLHRANAENQSMMRRSAPIMARRLSLPYARLPKLLPKPSIAKRLPTTQINGPNGSLINVHRIGSQNIVLSTATPSASASASTSASILPKQTIRPVPGLNKVINSSNMVMKNGQQIVPKQNLVLIRKSMRPPESSAQPSAPNTLKAIKVSTKTAWVPIRPAQITRMPPALTPAPKGIKLPVKTYSKNKDGLPVISQVRSIDTLKHNKLNRTTPNAINSAKSLLASSPAQNTLRFKSM